MVQFCNKLSISKAVVEGFEPDQFSIAMTIQKPKHSRTLKMFGI
jgi:hypothetical protein